MTIEKEEKLKRFGVMLDETAPYRERLSAYEFLLEDCEDILPEMIESIYAADGESADMLMEVLAEYKGNKEIYLGLVGRLYKGEDVALYARLLGKYGDVRAVEVLKSYAEEYELDYNEFMEVRNAIEELGGYFEAGEDGFTEDPFYRYIKGLDEVEEDSRKSPFEDMFCPSEKHTDDYDD